MKILVVEDETNNMILMTHLLKHYGHEPIEAFTGTEGIERTTSSKPDLVLMDLKLPDMDGFEATRRIRETNKNVPIIAVTAYSIDDIREEFNIAGFNGYIQKPINPSTIMDEIKTIMALNISF
jgi:two-component system, cell cycle response regulator DivK